MAELITIEAEDEAAHPGRDRHDHRARPPVPSEYGDRFVVYVDGPYAWIRRHDGVHVARHRTTGATARDPLDTRGLQAARHRFSVRSEVVEQLRGVRPQRHPLFLGSAHMSAPSRRWIGSEPPLATCMTGAHG